MPFRSEKQRKYLWKNHPKIAKDWTDTYGSKPVKKKHGGVHNTWQNQFYRTAQKIDKAIENWPEERKRLKKNFKTNVKNLINKIKKEGGHTPDDAIPKKKSGGSRDPYYGSYIKGRVDGKTLSNPSYRKYYKGLI